MSFGFYMGGIIMTIIGMICLTNLDKGIFYYIGLIWCFLNIIFMGWEEINSEEDKRKK